MGRYRLWRRHIDLSIPNEMKAILWILLVLCVLFATNPDEGDHQGAVRDEYSNGSSVLNGLFHVGAKKYVKSKDYYIFSITEFNGVVIGYGVLNKVYLTVKIEELDGII